MIDHWVGMEREADSSTSGSLFTHVKLSRVPIVLDNIASCLLPLFNLMLL